MNDNQEELLGQQNQNQKSQGFFAKFFSNVDKPLISLCVMNFFLNCGVSIIVPFFPPYSIQHYKVSNSMNGWIFSVLSVGAFGSSFIIGKMMSVWGKKNLMIFGLVFQTISILAFGLIAFIPDDETSSDQKPETLLWIICAMLSRLIQGISRSAYSSTSFSYVPKLWPTKISQTIALMEVLTALGAMAGPSIGSALNKIGTTDRQNYMIPFFVMAGIFALFIYPTYSLLPPDDDKSVARKKAPMGAALKNNVVLISFIVLIWQTTGLAYYSVLLSKHIMAYGFKESMTGYLLTCQGLFYLVMLITSRWWITKIQRKFLISFGFLIGVIAKELLGPNTAIFGISENNVVVIGFGLGMNGIAMACMALPFIPDVIETIGKSMDPQSVNNIGAALFVGGYSAGYFVGPITGGYIFDGYLNKNQDECPYDPNSSDQAFNKCEIIVFSKTSNWYFYGGAILFIIYMIYAQGAKNWVIQAKRICGIKQIDKKGEDTFLSQTSQKLSQFSNNSEQQKDTNSVEEEEDENFNAQNSLARAMSVHQQ